MEIQLISRVMEHAPVSSGELSISYGVMLIQKVQV